MSHTTVGQYTRHHRVAIAIAVCAYAVLFWPVLAEWARDCWELDDFSHCLAIPVIAGAVLWARRRDLAAENVSRGIGGLILLLVSLPLFFYGFGHSFNVFQRVAALGALVGLVGFVFGDRLLRRNLFPFGYLVLAVPIPFVVYSKVSIWLRGIVTRIAANVLQMCGVPAVDHGNVLTIDDLQLGVVDACSGIRSIMAILSVAVLLAYLCRSRVVGGALLLAMTLPIAVLLNIVRVLVMAYVLYAFDVDLTTGALHEVLGLAIFALIIALMYMSWAFIRWFLRYDDGDARPQAA